MRWLGEAVIVLDDLGDLRSGIRDQVLTVEQANLIPDT